MSLFADPASIHPSATLSRRKFVGGLGAGVAAWCALPTGAVQASSGSGLRFEHIYGETVLDRPAKRVVSLGYNTQDPLLALGVVPLAVRHWFGNASHGIWPWAEPYLGDGKPAVLTGEVSMERVAQLAPDLIVGIGSGISQAEYSVLSQIAPVLMQGSEDTSYGMRWDDMTRMIARAVGRSERAEKLIGEVDGKFAAARRRHPEFEGRTAVAAYHFGGETGVFIGSDTRARFLSLLGFKPTQAAARLSSANGFYAPVSPEDLSPLDADVLVWVSSYDAVPDLVNLPLRRTLRAHSEGREVLAGKLAAAAMSFGSVLSLPFVLEMLEPEIVAALDGDTDTSVPSAVEAGIAP